MSTNARICREVGSPWDSRTRQTISIWWYSSIGRTPPSYGDCWEFKSLYHHQFRSLVKLNIISVYEIEVGGLNPSGPAKNFMFACAFDTHLAEVFNNFFTFFLFETFSCFFIRLWTSSGRWTIMFIIRFFHGAIWWQFSHYILQFSICPGSSEAEQSLDKR